MLHGILHLSVWQYAISALILTHITIVGVTVFLHRCQAHRALDLHPIPSHFLRFWLWLTTGMVTKEWVAIHRKHHDTCETEVDPHSPQIKGINKVLFEGAELYRRESRNLETVERYGKGTPDDFIESKLYKPYSRYGVVLMLIINLLLFGLPGVTIWAVQMAWIPFFAAGVINGIGHYWGYRNFECADESRNIVPWAILIGGEELHNNHHTYPRSAKLSVKWWEFDIGWFYIRLLSFLKLAKVHKIAPKPVYIPPKASIDYDTLVAVVSNRFQIMAHYTQAVIMPVFNAERKKAAGEAKAIYTKVKSLLIREDSLVDESGKKQLSQLFEYSDTIKLVYQYRQKLRDIGNRTTNSKKELLEALQDWCKQAEETSIDALREFAASLRTYSAGPVKD